MHLNLFEYKWNKPLPERLTKNGDFESFLDEIWKEHPKVDWFGNEFDKSKSDEGKQRFIRFRANEFSPRNYVGVIHYKNTEINLLPKIFYEEGIEPSSEQIKNIHLHILYWLSYNKKIQFPKSLSNLDSIKIDSFFEILILMFATYTREALNRVLYQNYHEVNQDNQFIKGRLDINGYIKNNITTGNWQRVTCDYDSFDIDNRFNRIIKYVSKMLLPHTQNDASQTLLGEIIFLLDDVEDAPMTIDECDKVNLNPFYKELNMVLDYCKLFLSNSMIYSTNDNFEVFAFLLPMEKIFEDFVGGFLEEKFNDYKIKLQKSDIHLAKNNDNDVFQLKPDIYIESKNMIIDTKYKVLDFIDSDKKKGVSQSDMYQMVSYAIRYKVNNFVLLYPEFKDDKNQNIDLPEFVVKDKFAPETHEIKIRIHKLPIIAKNYTLGSYSDLKNKLDGKISDSFKEILNQN